MATRRRKPAPHPKAPARHHPKPKPKAHPKPKPKARPKGPVAHANPKAKVRVPTPPRGLVLIQQEDGRRRATGELGDATPQISAGFGGFQTVERGQRTSLVWWPGRDPQAVTFQVVFDGREDWASVEERCQVLETMAGARLPDHVSPPVVVFDSHGVVPLDRQDPVALTWRWVISSLDPQDADRDRRGRRVWAPFNVTLMRWVADDSLREQSAAVKRARAKHQAPRAKARHRAHVVKRGETLVSIAAREYGDADRWQDIAKANHLRDPRHPLKPGTHLKLP